MIQQLWQDGTYLDEIDCYTYAYDRAGNVTDRVNDMDLVLTDHYVYDDLDRLIEWDEGSPLVQQKVWSLDSLGNNISTTTGGTYDAANEETSIVGSSVTPAYDAAGNMIVLSSGGTAKYDAWNRLEEVDNGSTIVQKNEYDGAGRRIQIFSDFTGSTPGTTEDDYYVGQQVVETRGGDGDVQYQNIWSPRYIDAMILRDTYSGGDLVLADRVFYLSDANYNVTGLMKYNGDYGEWDIVERYAYTPYGVVTYFDHYWNEAEDQTVSAYANTTLYAGRTLDLSTALYYNRARYYDATMERFISTDPAESSPNLYEYVGENPLTRTDPSGLRIANVVVGCNGFYNVWGETGSLWWKGEEWLGTIRYNACCPGESFVAAEMAQQMEGKGKPLGDLQVTAYDILTWNLNHPPAEIKACTAEESIKGQCQYAERCYWAGRTGEGDKACDAIAQQIKELQAREKEKAEEGLHSLHDLMDMQELQRMVEKLRDEEERCKLARPGEDWCRPEEEAP